MSCGTSSASARSPSAKRSAGSAPGPPLWPGTWKRPEPRNPYATRASRYGALGCSLGFPNSGTRRTLPALPARFPQKLGAHESVQVAVEDRLRVADLVVGPVVLDHRVGVQDVGADLRSEVHVLRIAFLACQLLRALALALLDELGAQHLERRLAVLRLRALVLALHDYAARPVRDPDGRVGLVDVLAARARRAVGIHLQVVGVDLDLAGVLDDGRDLNAREARLPPMGGVERAQPHQAVHAFLGRVQAVGVLAADPERRGLYARLLPRAGLEQLDAETTLLGPAHLHAQHHLRPVLGVGPARAGVDGDQRVARVVVTREQACELERRESVLDRGEVRLELVGDRLVLGGQLDQALEVLDLAHERLEFFDATGQPGMLGRYLGRPLLIVPEARRPHLLLEPARLALQGLDVDAGNEGLQLLLDRRKALGCRDFGHMRPIYGRSTPQVPVHSWASLGIGPAGPEARAEGTCHLGGRSEQASEAGHRLGVGRRNDGNTGPCRGRQRVARKRQEPLQPVGTGR